MSMLKQQYFNSQFLKFVGVGGFAALVNFSSRFLLNHYMSYTASIALAYLIGMTTAYIFFKLLVFNESQHKTRTEMIWFTFVNLIGLLQIVIVSVFFADIVFKPWFNKEISEAAGHFVGLCSTVFVSFIGHKYFTFKMKEES